RKHGGGRSPFEQELGDIAPSDVTGRLERRFVELFVTLIEQKRICRVQLADLYQVVMRGEDKARNLLVSRRGGWPGHLVLSPAVSATSVWNWGERGAGPSRVSREDSTASSGPNVDGNDDVTRHL